MGLRFINHFGYTKVTNVREGLRHRKRGRESDKVVAANIS